MPLTIHSLTRVVKVGDQFTGPIVDYLLGQNQPNPFDTKTIIPFSIPQAQQVSVTIYNQLGQLVKVLQGEFVAGKHQLEWDGLVESGQKANSGAYYYQMKAGKFCQTKKLLIIY